MAIYVPDHLASVRRFGLLEQIPAEMPELQAGLEAFSGKLQDVRADDTERKQREGAGAVAKPRTASGQMDSRESVMERAAR